MADTTEQELIVEIIDNLVIDKHINTTCANFISTCYNLFYSTTSTDVTLVVDSTSYTIPNVKKNQELGVNHIEGVVDPENSKSGVLGQIYYNTLNQKVFFKSTSSGNTGWILLFQYVASPNEEDALDNLNQLLINTQNIVSTYYNVFYNQTPMDVTLQLYENGSLVTKTIPNRAKSLVIALTGNVDPENTVEGTLGRMYVNISTQKVFIKTTSIGNTGWCELLNNSSIEAHNVSTTAHDGILAKLNGDENQSFRVAFPSADAHAVNLGYTGNLGDLATTNKNTLVGAINEINSKIPSVTKLVEDVSNAPKYCFRSGNVDLSGNADLIVSDASSTYYKNEIVEEQEITNINNSWTSYTDQYGEDATDRYENIILGNIFGAGVGTGRYVYKNWSQHKGSDGGWYDGTQYFPATDYIYSFGDNPLGAGSYKFLFCKMEGYSSSYTLSYRLTGQTEYISVEVPSDVNLSSERWTQQGTPITITGNDSIAEIKVHMLMTQGTCCPALNLVEVISSPSYQSYLYFKVGGEYPTLVGSTADSRTFTVNALPIIDMRSQSDGTYNIFVKSTGIVEVLGNTFYRQKVAPSSPVLNDVWLNTSVLPLSVQKYNGSTWDSYDGIPIGQAIVASNIISSVSTFPYNCRHNTTASGAVPGVIIETYQNGTSWYRIWSNGLIEQGGQQALTTSATTITLSKSFSDTNYNISTTCTSGYATYGTKTTTTLVLTGSGSITCMWKASGF